MNNLEYQTMSYGTKIGELSINPYLKFTTDELKKYDFPLLQNETSFNIVEKGALVLFLAGMFFEILGLAHGYLNP